MAVVTHNNIGHFTPAGYKEPYLSLYFMRYGGDLTDQLARDNIMFGYSSAAEILKTFYLAGLEAAGFTLDPVYG